MWWRRVRRRWWRRARWSVSRVSVVVDALVGVEDPDGDQVQLESVQQPGERVDARYLSVVVDDQVLSIDYRVADSTGGIDATLLVAAQPVAPPPDTTQTGTGSPNGATTTIPIEVAPNPVPTITTAPPATTTTNSTTTITTTTMSS